MKSSKQRIQNIIGQLSGVVKMMDEGSDCVSVLTQLKASRSAINSVMGIVIENQFDKCSKGLNKKDKDILLKIRNYVSTN